MSPHRRSRWSEGDGWAFPRRSFRSATPSTLRRHLSRQAQLKTLHLEEFEHRVLPTFTLGAAANYAIIYEGGGSNNFQVTNVMTNVTGSGPSQGGGIGNIGVGGWANVKLNGPGTFNGNLDIAAANRGQVGGTGVSVTGSINYNVSAVTNALNTVNALNTTLGALPGANVAISGNTTINAVNGAFSASGTGYSSLSS